MKTFHYLPPAPEEQKSFVAQLLGTIVALGLVAAAWIFLKETRMHAILIGVSLGAIYLLAQVAWKLEVKAQRAQNAEIVLDETDLRLTNRKGETQNDSNPGNRKLRSARRAFGGGFQRRSSTRSRRARIVRRHDAGAGTFGAMARQKR